MSQLKVQLSGVRVLSTIEAENQQLSRKVLQGWLQFLPLSQREVIYQTLLKRGSSISRRIFSKGFVRDRIRSDQLFIGISWIRFNILSCIKSRCCRWKVSSQSIGYSIRCQIRSVIYIRIRSQVRCLLAKGRTFQ